MKKRDYDYSLSINRDLDGKFFKAIKKVLDLLKVDDKTNYGRLITSSIRQRSAEIELKIDVFLEDLKIPFRTEEFLLILFQELYEDFIFSKENVVEKLNFKE